MEPNIPVTQPPVIEPIQNPVQPPTPIQQPIKSNPFLVKKSFLKLPFFIIGIILIFGLIGGGFFLAQKSRIKVEEVKLSPTPTTSLSHEEKPTATTSPSAKTTLQKNSNPTPTKTPTAKSTPTTTPRIANPPIVNITFPTEGQSIEYSSSQTFCMIDMPAGGNQEGVQRKHDINDGGWTSYSDMFTLCFTPKEGLNRIQLQYKNKFGDESSQYTRQFNFHLISNINISLSGSFFEDKNCNLSRDSGEGPITNVSLQIVDSNAHILATTATDNNGNYNYSGTIRENESITLWPQTYGVSGYMFKAHYVSPKVTLNSTNKTGTIDVPMVPIAYDDSCVQ